MGNDRNQRPTLGCPCYVIVYVSFQLTFIHPFYSIMLIVIRPPTFGRMF